MHSRRLLLPLAFSAAALAQQPAYTAVPLKDCDRLLLAPVEIDGRKYDFLVDTGATSLLNAKSFRGSQRDIVISSYRGESALKGSAVRVRDLKFGSAALHDLTLKAIDLSAIGDACGSRVDGLLGVDLLEKLDATIDVRKRIAKVAGKSDQVAFAALRDRMLQCNALFNDGDATHFREQFAKDVVWVGPTQELRGRDEVVRYIEENYTRKGAKIVSDIRPEDFHIEGDTYWVNFDYSLLLPERNLRVRSTMVAKLHDGKWQVQTAHNSLLNP